MTKRWLFIIIGGSVVIGGLWVLIRWGVNGGWPGSGAIRDQLPPHIQYVVPGDGLRVENAYGICVHINYLAGRGLADESAQSLRFFLDGKHVTRDVVDVVRLEYGYPAPQGEPCYKQAEPLRPGWHTARVIYEDQSGERFEYRWRFEIFGEE